MVTDDEQTADKLTFKITAAHNHHHYKEVVWNPTQHYRFDIYYHRSNILNRLNNILIFNLCYYHRLSITRGYLIYGCSECSAGRG